MFLSGKLRKAQISSFFTLYYVWFSSAYHDNKKFSDVHISPHMMQAIYTCNNVKLEQVKGKLYQHRLVPVC